MAMWQGGSRDLVVFKSAKLFMLNIFAVQSKPFFFTFLTFHLGFFIISPSSRVILTGIEMLK